MGDEVRVHQQSTELIASSEVPGLLGRIRPQWRARDLIQRVERLLPVDPSSACQRLLNAAIRDLRDKVQVAGLDIAAEVAAEYKLPAIGKQDDVENYSTYNVIALAYRMGLLSRPEWRRLTRAYEIRRDLEHEDSEYEAGIEDLVYVFTTCIDAVLAKDPITLLRVPDVKDVIEAASPLVASADLLDDYAHAPDTRQIEIGKFLLSTALDDDQPDLVRQNANTLMRQFAGSTRNAVLIQLASHMQARLKRVPLTEFHVRIAAAAGILPYLKRAQRRDFFAAYLEHMENVGYNWRSHADHGALLRQLQEFGGLDAVPDELRSRYLKWLALCYIGEPGGYGQGINRRVFYSNVAAPIIAEMISGGPSWLAASLAELRKDKNVKGAMRRDDAIARRFEALVDIFEAGPGS